jgi:Fe-S-cluster-containing dehydrogenase component
MLGCPVEAYSKDHLTGIVDHNPDQCIGCQYCTWNCSYGVPQFNPERGVVGKCDMCHSRLTAGAQPACVNARPIDITGAGDAMIAGTLHSILNGENTYAAARVGALLGTLTTENSASVHTELSERFLEANMHRLAG